MTTDSYLSKPLLRYSISLIAVVLSAWVQFGSPYVPTFADEWLRDSFIKSRAIDRTDNRIVVVDIDESSLRVSGPWPWPRTRIADLVEILLDDYGIRGVALDMVFPDSGDTTGDQRLAEMALNKPLVLAQALDFENRRSPLRIGTISGGETAELDVKTQTIAYGYIANHAGLAGSRYVGNIGFIPDSDGIIRRLPGYASFEGKLYPTLSIGLIQCCSDRSLSTSYLQHPWIRVPYTHELSSYTVVSAADVLNLRVPLAELAGKLILVGSSSLGLSDSVATPLSPNTSGVFVHASMLSAMLDQSDIQPTTNWPGKTIAILYSILVISLATYTLARSSAMMNAALLVVFSLIWIVLAYYVSPHDSVFSTTSPLVAFAFMLAVAIPYHWQVTQHKSRALLDTLNHYVAPVVVQEILDKGLTNPLAPKRVHITTLIADMESYTKHIEGLDLNAATDLTREFLDCLTNPVLESRGTLDKYTGDGLMAFWGAPIHDEDHADLALDAALQILRAIERLNEIRTATGASALRVRIGIESGIAMAGDFGSSFRSIYTAVGDCVNTASRLQEVARDLPHDVVLGPGTAKLSKRHPLARLSQIQLRGKKKSTQLYTLQPPDQSCDSERTIA